VNTQSTRLLRMAGARYNGSQTSTLPNVVGEQPGRHHTNHPRAAGGRRQSRAALSLMLRGGFHATVVVAVTSVWMMQVAAHEIVRVPGVRHTRMAACWAMDVSFLMAAARVIRRAVRSVRARGVERVFVHVVAMDVVQMPVVEIVRVAVVLHRHVAAGGSVRVRVSVVLLALLSHYRAPLARPPRTAQGHSPRLANH